MNGIFLLIGIHVCFALWQRKRAAIYDLTGIYEIFDRALTQRDFGFVGVQLCEEGLGPVFMSRLQHALMQGSFRSEAWRSLKWLLQDCKEELLKLQKIQLQLHTQVLVPGISVIFLRIVLEKDSGLWYRPEALDGCVWLLYLLLLKFLTSQHPKPLLFERQYMADVLGMYLGAQPCGVWESLGELEAQAAREGRSPEKLRQDFLEGWWLEQKHAFQRRLLIWEEGLPVLELCVFLVLAVSLCLPVFFKYLGTI